ncbi:mitochondrial tricarboxylate transporter [Colletotrichum musicola]|uniref:Mitochondrial tricarboxylate transporter n=1 Tax=Colletotrichum musicola TaxID=2175873 RepID=A0A8H6KED1_9PEZI|nr:mitochondrial tricarboxylate transporter [Colletotrichum musicola]
MSEWITNQKEQNDPPRCIPRHKPTFFGSSEILITTNHRELHSGTGPAPPRLPLLSLRHRPPLRRGRLLGPVASRQRARARLDAPRRRGPETEPEPHADWAIVVSRLNIGAAGSACAGTSSEATKTKVIHDAASPSANAGRGWRGAAGGGAGPWRGTSGGPTERRRASAGRAGYQQRGGSHRSRRCRNVGGLLVLGGVNDVFAVASLHFFCFLGRANKASKCASLNG